MRIFTFHFLAQYLIDPKDLMIILVQTVLFYHSFIIRSLACRYEKGAWGECQTPTGDMTRLDKLKATSDSATCAPTRTMNKKCNKSKQDKQNKQRTKEKKQNGKLRIFFNAMTIVDPNQILQPFISDRKNRQ